MLEFFLHTLFFFVDQSFFGFCVCDLEVNYLSFPCLQFGHAFVEESLEVSFLSNSLFPLFAKLGDGFVVTSYQASYVNIRKGTCPSLVST